MNKQEICSHIAKRIKFYRKRLNKKQSDIANKLDITNVQLCKWEQGTVDISISKLYTLASILNTTVMELLPMVEVPTLDERDIKILSILESSSVDKENVLNYIKFLKEGNKSE
jgi:transcriptional regulator with XRE-family HTH domain